MPKASICVAGRDAHRPVATVIEHEAGDRSPRVGFALGGSGAHEREHRCDDAGKEYDLRAAHFRDARYRTIQVLLPDRTQPVADAGASPAAAWVDET